MLSPGDVLNGRYRLAQRIAAGGMGEVWRGEDLLLQREIAVKVLLPALMSDSDFITRFRAEARMMAALRHPGVVQVYDYGENAQVGAHRLDFLVMEFIDGIPLSAKIQQAGRLSPADTMAAVAQAADALQAAHDAGIIHRDVKPSNLLVRPAGAIVLVDFGVARSTGVTGITGTNVVLGSAHYMAPEQAEGRPVTAATDVYAVGAVAFSCLTGRPPYVGDNPLAVLAQLVHGQPPVLPPDVPPAVAAVVMRALARDPRQRHPSAAALAAAARGASSAPSRPGRPLNSAPATRSASPAPGSPAGRAAGPGFAPRVSPPRPSAVPGTGFPAPTGSPPRSSAAPGTGSPGIGSPAGPMSGRFAAVPGPRPGSHGGLPAAGRSTGGPGFTPGAASVGVPAGGGTFGTALTAGSRFDETAGPTPAPGSAIGPGAAVSRRRRNSTVALAAAAVVALLAGVGIILGSGPDRTDPTAGAADTSGQQLPAVGTSGKTPGRSTSRPKPSAKNRPTKESTPPPDPAGPGQPTAATTTDPDEPGDPGSTGTNPYADPVGLCGDGYQVIDSKGLQTAAGVLRGTVYLLHREQDAMNCVVTVRAGALDGKAAMSAALEVNDESPVTSKGRFQYYAGPVTAAGPDDCVRWGGTIGGLSFVSSRPNCD